MTDQPDQIQQAEQTATQSSSLSLQGVGRLLVEAREKSGLSVDEVASRLRLMPRQVLALESGDIDALPGPAFVRGFLRNYAKLLQIDAEPLLEACRVHVPEISPSQISLHSENILIVGRERKGWSIYLAAVAIIILMLAAWFAYMDFTSGKSEPAEPAEPVNAAIPHDLPDTAIMPPIQSLPQTADGVQPAPGEAAPQATPQELTAPAAAAGASTLVLSTTQTSWVSVQDRDGKEIFSKNVTSGNSETVTGTPPLRLVIGNATGMQLTYNGNPVDLAPHIRANVARLTLE
jgi:cytoskeleton protein RodZ